MSTTGNALATRNGTVAQPTGALAIRPGQATWEEVQVAAFGQIGIADAPDGDRQVFLHVSQRTGLDPFARQIYMIPRSEKKSEKRGNTWVDTYVTKWTIQTGIEGWRVIRDRAERREGVRGVLSRPVYYDPEGGEFKVWVRRDPPVAVEYTYTVRDANGIETPYTSILRFDEYVQRKDGKAIAQWASKPTHMLEKCTEADVYRKAFPQDFSGVYLDDAMPAPDPGAPATQPQRQRVTAEQARQRVQRVQSTVVKAEPPADDSPWPDGAETAQSSHPSRPDEPDRDPRDAIRTALAALGIGASQAVADYVTQIAQVNASADLSSLTREQAEGVLRVLGNVTTRKELDELLASGEVSDGQ